MNKDSKIYVAGHRGLAGSAIVRELKRQGYTNLLLKTSQELDLLNPLAVEKLFAEENPEYVFMCAGTVGGIVANSSYPVEFTQNNSLMAIHVLSAAHRHGVKKLLYLGSSCIYPKECPQPMKEEYLLTGTLDPTNEGYALAKIMGIKLCEYYQRQYNKDFIAVMPSNLYGPNDNYDLEHSHVISALLRRFHEAKQQNEKEIMVWGSGLPRREFTYIDDFANGAVFAMQNDIHAVFLNMGAGSDISIKDLAYKIAEITGYQGKISFDLSKPDGVKQKLMDSVRFSALGWSPTVSLDDGLRSTYHDFVKNWNASTIKEHKIR